MRTLSLLAGFTIVATVIAGRVQADGVCARCGCQAECRKACRLVCEDKKIGVCCYGCKCEHFCLPGPSYPGCKHSGFVCESCELDCQPGGVHVEPKRFSWREWLPSTTSTTFRRVKLMRKTETVTVPGYKWVVEDVCDQCAMASTAEAAASDAESLPSSAAQR